MDDQARQAWSQESEALTRKRSRSVYTCFLVCGVFALVLVAVVEFAPEYTVLLGLGVAPWVAIAGLVGLCNALMTWRVPRVRTLLFLTLFLLVSYVILDLAPPSWVSVKDIFGAVMFSGSGLLAIVVSLRGLKESAAPDSA